MWSFFKQPTYSTWTYSPAPSQLGLISQRWCVRAQVSHFALNKTVLDEFVLYRFYLNIFLFELMINSIMVDWTTFPFSHEIQDTVPYIIIPEEWGNEWFDIYTWNENCRNILTLLVFLPASLTWNRRSILTIFLPKSLIVLLIKSFLKKEFHLWVGQIGSIHCLELGLFRACMKSRKLSWTSSDVFLVDGKTLPWIMGVMWCHEGKEKVNK